MKLSKSLLSAVLIGITLHATSSCKKENTAPDQKAKKESTEKKNSTPTSCVACGMG